MVIIVIGLLCGLCLGWWLDASPPRKPPTASPQQLLSDTRPLGLLGFLAWKITGVRP